MVYSALLPLMRKPRLPVVDWTDAPPPYLNRLVRFAERRNLVSACVPSHFNWPLPISPSKLIARNWQNANIQCVTAIWQLIYRSAIFRLSFEKNSDVTIKSPVMCWNFFWGGAFFPQFCQYSNILMSTTKYYLLTCSWMQVVTRRQRYPSISSLASRRRKRCFRSLS
jgi:hypothetical protein